MAGWDLGGSSGRSLDHLRIRKLAGEGTAVGFRNLHRIAAVAVGVVAVGSCFLQGLGGCSRKSRTAAPGDRVNTADRLGRSNRGKTVRGHDLGRRRRKAAGKMVEVNAGRLVEANDHIPAGREKNIGRVEELAVHIEGPADYTKAFVLVGSSPGWRLDCSHSCCLQRYCLGVDIVSCLLYSFEDTSMLCRVAGARRYVPTFDRSKIRNVEGSQAGAEREINTYQPPKTLVQHKSS